MTPIVVSDILAVAENEVILVDFDEKMKIHHYVGAKLPFSIKYEDYFPVAKK